MLYAKKCTLFKVIATLTFMSWQKVVTYTPYEYKQEMKRRGLLMILFTIVFIVALVGFGVWWSSIQNSSPWDGSGFLAPAGLDGVNVFGAVCNSSGLYIGVLPGLGVKINQIQVITISGFSSINTINSSNSNSFYVYYYPKLICSKVNQYYSADVKVYAIDTFTGGNPANEVITGRVWGISDTCQFSQGSINCNP